MKSRISFCNGAVFRKNLTRFFPAWTLYSVFLLLFFLLMMDGAGSPRSFANDMGTAICFFGVVNAGYALLNAQLLFGDLYNSRMCNAIHALSPRRETLFFTNVLSGLFFSVIPNAVLALLMMPFLEEYWFVSLIWLGGNLLSYLFFFGLAVFCALCVGNRFAMVLFYGIINFFALLAYWIIESLYIPNLYGVVMDTEWFFWLCPIVKMAQQEMFYIHNEPTATGFVYDAPDIGGYMEFFVDGWLYFGICAALGIALLVLALVLYRRRHLESAGDFIVVKPLAPVFLILYTLSVGTGLQLFFDIFTGVGSWFYLMVGIAVGYFTGQMLLKRTPKVFNKKTLLGFGCFAATAVLSLVLTVIDPLGITRWVPKPEDVKQVTVYNNSYYGSGLTFEDKPSIGDITAIHRAAVDYSENERSSYDKSYVNLYINYTLNSGITVQRNYRVFAEEEEGQLLKKHLTAPKAVLGDRYTTPADYAVSVSRVYVDGAEITANTLIESLVTAIAADCEAGNMAQVWGYHDDTKESFWVTFEFYNALDRDYFYREVVVYADCQNTMDWIYENGILLEKYE